MQAFLPRLWLQWMESRLEVYTLSICSLTYSSRTALVGGVCGFKGVNRRTHLCTPWTWFYDSPFLLSEGDYATGPGFPYMLGI